MYFDAEAKVYAVEKVTRPHSVDLHCDICKGSHKLGLHTQALAHQSKADSSQLSTKTRGVSLQVTWGTPGHSGYTTSSRSLSV